LPKHPVFFSKAVTAVIGPIDPIPFDARVTTKLDWEVELGVVIGRGGKNIAEADAMDHVFGYTVINDVSARDLQRRHGGQWLKGKSLDGTCPMGPCIVTRDELDGAVLAPTQNARPVPVSTTARTSSSQEASSQARAISRSIRKSNAFSTSGRFSRTVARGGAFS